MKARVTAGRLQLDSPCKLPDGTEVEVVLADDLEHTSDDLTDGEREALAVAHDAAVSDHAAGRTVDLGSFVGQLRTGR